MCATVTALMNLVGLPIELFMRVRYASSSRERPLYSCEHRSQFVSLVFMKFCIDSLFSNQEANTGREARIRRLKVGYPVILWRLKC